MRRDALGPARCPVGARTARLRSSLSRPRAARNSARRSPRCTPDPRQALAAERTAVATSLIAPLVAQRVLAAVDEPVVLMKGPEVAQWWQNPLTRSYPRPRRPRRGLGVHLAHAARGRVPADRRSGALPWDPSSPAARLAGPPARGRGPPPAKVARQRCAADSRAAAYRRPVGHRHPRPARARARTPRRRAGRACLGPRAARPALPTRRRRRARAGRRPRRAGPHRSRRGMSSGSGARPRQRSTRSSATAAGRSSATSGRGICGASANRRCSNATSNDGSAPFSALPPARAAATTRKHLEPPVRSGRRRDATADDQALRPCGRRRVQAAFRPRRHDSYQEHRGGP